MYAGRSELGFLPQAEEEVSDESGGSDTAEVEVDPEVQAKRRKAAETFDIEERLESLINRVGEKSTSSLEKNLQGLTSVLEKDLPSYKHTILKILSQAIRTLPEKLTIYSTLVGLLNLRNYNAVGELLELLVRDLKEALRDGRFEMALVIIRFLADLVNSRVIIAPSLLKVFDNFVDVSSDRTNPQMRSDWYVYAVLSTLPWVGAELYEKRRNDFNNLLKTIEEYLSRRQKIHVGALRVWSKDDPHPQEEYLDCLSAQIKQLAKNGWVEKQIYRPYRTFETIFCEALQHSLPEVMPPGHHDDMEYPLPRVVFRMFDYTDVPEDTILPGAHAIERFLIEEQITNVFTRLCVERRECALGLLSIPSRGRIPLEYMVAEVIFGMLFRLPSAPHAHIVYGAVLHDLCRESPNTMPLVLAQLTQMVYERIDSMNTTCIDRFTDWLAYHLSNCQFTWTWDEWSDCLDGDIEAPKAKAIRELLNRCMRLSYHKRVCDIVPESFAPLLPLKPSPCYRYAEDASEDLPGLWVARKLHTAFKSKCSPEDTLVHLKSLPNPLSDGSGIEVISYNPLKIDVFVQTLFYLGHKSFSHSFAAIAKFHVILKMLCDCEAAQVCLMNSLYYLWRSHQQMLSVLIDKLLKTEVVECSAVAEWVFCDELQQDLTCFYVWEILHNAINRMNNHVTRLQKEFESSRDVYETAQRKRRDNLPVDMDDVPTEEMLERKEERLRAAQTLQKDLFISIFKHMIVILTKHLDHCDSEGVDRSSHWFKWISERLQQIFIRHHSQVYRYINTLESQIFTSDIDVHILQVFQQFCSLKS